MLSLSKNLRDHTRSFLSFKEIHKTRSVCKSWADIENVPKDLKWYDLDSVSPHACFTRITQLLMVLSSKTSKFMFQQILQRNHQHLSSLKFEATPECLFFPQLKQLKKLEVWEANKETVNAIIRKAANLRELRVHWKEEVVKEIDLSHCPHLENLVISSAKSIKNFSATHLSRIHFTEAEDVDDIVQFLSLPLLEVEIDIHGVNDDGDPERIFCLLSKSNELIIQSVTEISWAKDSLDIFAEKLESVITAIKSIRDTRISINPTIQDNKYRKREIFDIAFLLCRTELLTGKEIAEIVQQALE